MMTFGSAVSTCLQRKYVDFSGRASRSEFWWFALFQIVVLVVASMIHEAVYGIAALALLLPALAVGARRLHDVGRSGWWLVLYFVPFVGFLVLLYWNVQPSQPQANAFGEPPLAAVQPPSFLPPGNY